MLAFYNGEMIEKRVVILHVSHQELKLRGFNFVSYLATLLATETPYFAAGLLILLGAEKAQCCLQLIVLLRRFISNCSGNENLLKLIRGEVYDMLIVNTETKVAVTELVSKIAMTSAVSHLFPHMGAILTRILLKMCI